MVWNMEYPCDSIAENLMLIYYIYFLLVFSERKFETDLEGWIFFNFLAMRMGMEGGFAECFKYLIDLIGLGFSWLG